MNFDVASIQRIYLNANKSGKLNYLNCFKPIPMIVT